MLEKVSPHFFWVWEHGSQWLWECVPHLCCSHLACTVYFYADFLLAAPDVT